MDEALSRGGGVSVSGVGIENLAALRWQIPLHTWWAMPRNLRVAHAAAYVAEGIRAPKEE